MEFLIKAQEDRESLMREIMISGINDCAKENQHYFDLLEITKLKQMTTVELVKIIQGDATPRLPLEHLRSNQPK